MTSLNQAFAYMRAEETRASGDQNALFRAGVYRHGACLEFEAGVIPIDLGNAGCEWLCGQVEFKATAPRLELNFAISSLRGG